MSLTSSTGCFPDAVPTDADARRGLLPKIRQAPTVTVKCSPLDVSGQDGLIGDATAIIVPFYGQGMNCGFGDCTVLNALLDEHGDDWKKLLPAWTSARKPNGDAIADLAILNFVEMRDRVGDRASCRRRRSKPGSTSGTPDKWLPRCIRRSPSATSRTA